MVFEELTRIGKKKCTCYYECVTYVHCIQSNANKMCGNGVYRKTAKWSINVRRPKKFVHNTSSYTLQ